LNPNLRIPPTYFKMYYVKLAGLRFAPVAGSIGCTLTFTSISRNMTIHQWAHVALRRLIRQRNQR
jgi:hypothetical protein